MREKADGQYDLERGFSTCYLVARVSLANMLPTQYTTVIE